MFHSIRISSFVDVRSIKKITKLEKRHIFSALGTNISIDSQIWYIYDVYSVSSWCIFINVHPYDGLEWYPMMATIIFFYICLCPNRFCHNFTISLWANTFYAANNGFHSIVMFEQWIVHKTEDVRSVVMSLDLFVLSGLFACSTGQHLHIFIWNQMKTPKLQISSFWRK